MKLQFFLIVLRRKWVFIVGLDLLLLLYFFSFKFCHFILVGKQEIIKFKAMHAINYSQKAVAAIKLLKPFRISKHNYALVVLRVLKLWYKFSNKNTTLKCYFPAIFQLYYCSQHLTLFFLSFNWNRNFWPYWRFFLNAYCWQLFSRL